MLIAVAMIYVKIYSLLNKFVYALYVGWLFFSSEYNISFLMCIFFFSNFLLHFSEFEELEAVPTSAVIEGPLEPSFTQSPSTDVPDDSTFVNFFSVSIPLPCVQFLVWGLYMKHSHKILVFLVPSAKMRSESRLKIINLNQPV